MRCLKTFTFGRLEVETLDFFQFWRQFESTAFRVRKIRSGANSRRSDWLKFWQLNSGLELQSEVGGRLENRCGSNDLLNKEANPVSDVDDRCRYERTEGINRLAVPTRIQIPRVDDVHRVTVMVAVPSISPPV